MDPELQALREARLSELKGSSGSAPANGGKPSAPSPGADSRPAVGTAIAPFLQPQALERLTRVDMVRPDRAQAVEAYLTKLISSGHVTRKISEEEIVQILHGVARQENKNKDTTIIFNRRDDDWENDLSTEKQNGNESDEDDFFE
ncbi:hypothetical protein ZYGR_0E00960 [Zygosaccharomyces rouxii]|uniref:ZYRO0B02134p n=2 Tax=Zygosaccharomyces rouxii TaxID=4956 RepID=C5DQQ3_ZYGRC|nr:uncharacterized protein ZYRO0B02134g [Zygosaccharomyces rouxii]KAH9200336.1 double-stranded DNA-binding domain-containing protein [Zygosaccharomyces rouxii]GAV47082.1 hypothetical protein ZYGR_0E00960 [Zygosaccharomyces rouxii]CAR26114.1 ZYRO0B02134p [Zygosaccharomyces rouxii]